MDGCNAVSAKGSGGSAISRKSARAASEVSPPFNLKDRSPVITYSHAVRQMQKFST